MTEEYANFAQTTLVGNINNSVTSLVVADATKFPDTGRFSVLIDDELITVDAVTGTTFSSLTRGEDAAYPAASHLDGALVTCVVSKRTLAQLRSDIVAKGAFGSLPTAKLDGRLYLPDDADVILRDMGIGNGWNQYGPLFKLTTPDPAAFTWTNQNLGTYTQVGGGLFLSGPAYAPSNLQCLLKTAPTPPYTITVFVIPYVWDTFNTTGLVLYESATHKAETIHLICTTGRLVNVESIKLDDLNTFNSVRASQNILSTAAGINWLRIVRDGSNNLSYQFSTDGLHWRELVATTATNFFTTGPDKVGIFVNCANAAQDAGGFFLHYQES